MILAWASPFKYHIIFTIVLFHTPVTVALYCYALVYSFGFYAFQSVFFATIYN